MNDFIGVLIGILIALVIVVAIYSIQVCIKLNMHKRKIKNILIQIKGQIDIKYGLLKDYVEINKDVIEEDKYIIINNKLNSYKNIKDIDIEKLKDFNFQWADYLKSFNDNLLIKQCEESEAKIECIKEYYNELVSFYNIYKSNSLNSFVAKTMSIEDEKLY